MNEAVEKTMQDTPISHIDFCLESLREKMEAEDIGPRGLIAQILGGGAEMKDYANHNTRLWNPETRRNEHDEVFVHLASRHPTGPQLRAITLQLGLDNGVPVRGSKTLGTLESVMVPYVKFDQEGELVPDESYLLLFTEEQVAQLRGILSSINS